MHVFHPRHLKPPGREETISTIKAICKRWNFWTEADARRVSRKQQKDNVTTSNVGLPHHDNESIRRGIVVCSHSNGSIAHGWLVNDAPEMILKNAFVDPVVFCLWEGGK
jgi:hypothetical protein